MAVSNGFIEYIREQLSLWGDITVRRMFGGAGLYHDRIMFALVADDVVYLKVNETNRDKYLLAGSLPLKPFPDRPAMPSFFELPPDILLESEKFIEWAKESLSIQKKRK
jgi:DNA transformation protein